MRSYIYVDDLVDGIRLLTGSDVEEPTNIGSRQYVAVAELVEAVASVAGKSISVRWVEGPVGVRSRNFSNDRIESLGFVTRHSLLDGLRATCPRVEQQAGAARAAERR